MLTDDDYARYRQLSCIAIISMAAPESDLLRQALDAVEINGHTGTFVLSHAAPSVPTALKLLQHARVEVRVHAALAEWVRDPQGMVREELREEWRAAVLESHDGIRVSVGSGPGCRRGAGIRLGSPAD